MTKECQKGSQKTRHKKKFGRVLKEREEAIIFTRYMKRVHKDIMFTHIANENQHLKVKEGLYAGIPDYFFPYANKGKIGLWIELKRTKGGVVSENQKCAMRRLEQIGHECKIARGWIEAVKCVEKYFDSHKLNI